MSFTVYKGGLTLQFEVKKLIDGYATVDKKVFNFCFISILFHENSLYCPLHWVPLSVTSIT